MNSRGARRLRIYLHAYWQQNLGDDLFVDRICERYPQVYFYGACSRRTSQAFESLPNFRRVPRFARVDALLGRAGLTPMLGSWVERLYKSRCDAVVNIGGSIFMEREGWRQRMAALRARFASGKPTFVIGSNFGPFSDPEYLDAMKALLKGAADICLRDKASAELLRDLPNCRYAPDVVLSMDETEIEHHNTAVLSVIDLERRPELHAHSLAYTTKLADIAEACVEDGMDVVLMGFCKNERDGEAIERLSRTLASRLDRDQVRTYIYDGNLREALALLSSASIIVATRFHAMILAWVFGKRVLPISYSEKMQHVIQDAGFPGLWTRLEDLGELDPSSTVRGLTAMDAFELAELRVQAQEQFMGLDLFVASGGWSLKTDALG